MGKVTAQKSQVSYTMTVPVLHQQSRKGHTKNLKGYYYAGYATPTEYPVSTPIIPDLQD